MSDSPEDEERIFAAALAVPANERAHFLDGACRENAVLRGRIEALILAHESAGSFMAAPAEGSRLEAAPASPPSATGDRAGTRIGRYKLLQQLGEGGCGVVWMAEQEEPVRRRVALKVIKLGMDTKNVIARFEAERQALALMDHPHIARVLDAGATESGRPYFVMELVPGIPITRFCDQHNLSTSARLGLLVQVCHAVQHAHQKGVIHRDLKPSNVLVTVRDAEPVPKVIDFGIAKSTQGRLTDQTLFTAFEQFIGTPAYMSPEQAELGAMDVDTRSDIYSLGVLLYELLTGRPPFDPKTLLQAGLDEIRRIIREQEPVKPSTRLNTLADADRDSIARQRGTAPARLSLLLRGDLDWIVMKALEKKRERRYETASGLALDIERHLQNEPVSARPPTALYRISRTMRRNRVAFAAIGSVALALIAGAVVSAEQALRAERAERRATEERAHAEDLLEFMLGDLRAQLAKVGRLDVLESASDKVLAYFSAREAQGMDDAALGRYSKALTQIGEIRMDQERYADALAAFMTAYDRASALVNRHPRNGEMLFARGQAEYWNGMVHWKRGELALAADWLGRYFQTSGTLVALDATKPEWISELAYGNHNLAALNKQRGELTEARAGFLGELTTLQKMEAGSPGNIELRFRTADAHSWLGGIALQEGDFSQALHEYGLERAILEGLVLAEPRTARWQFHLADTGLFRTDILAVTGQGSNARDELARAQELLDHLVALDPGNRHWQAASLHSRLLEASLMKQKGDLAGSALLVSQVRPQLEKLYAAEPTDRVLGRWLAWALRLEAQAGSAAAADRAVETGKKLIEDGRATDDDLGECARGYLIKGELEENLGEAEAARHLWERADQLLTPRLPGTHDWRLLDPAARVARRLGRTEVANAIIAQLDRLGYVPLDPWPVANGLDVASPKGAQHLTEHPRNQTGNE